MLRRVFHYSAALLVMAASVLVIKVLPGLAYVNQDGVTEIRGTIIDEVRQPVRQMPVRCQDKPWWPERVLREVRSNDEGAFVLAEIPDDIDLLYCTSGGSIFEPFDRIIPVKGHTSIEVIFLLHFRTIPVLEGWITSSTGGVLPQALVRVTQHGATFSRRADESGRVRFENLKAGDAIVEYGANGYTTDTKKYFLLAGSDLSTLLRPFWLPPGLLLLLPAIVVLALRAGIEIKQSKTPKEERSNPNPWLMLACLGGWGIGLLGLWHMPGGDESISFFNPRLSFSLLVPAFGFVGALVFVIDIFQAGKQNGGEQKEKEFALRLVLGPYAAIVMVLLFKDTFQFIELHDKLEAQAALAFFSGFLVVLALQGLTEKGNEILGRWRDTSRYEPSEIAARFKLDREEDLKLSKANLKYLAQLHTLPAAELQMLAKLTGLSAGLLVGMQKELRLDHLQATLGKETREKLSQKGVGTVWDVALLTPERLQELAKDLQLSLEGLQKFYVDCKALVQESYA